MKPESNPRRPEPIPDSIREQITDGFKENVEPTWRRWEKGLLRKIYERRPKPKTS